MYHKLFEFLGFSFCFSRAGISVSVLPIQGFLGGSMVKNPPANARGSVSIPSNPRGQEGPMEKGKATHCSILF